MMGFAVGLMLGMSIANLPDQPLSWLGIMLWVLAIPAGCAVAFAGFTLLERWIG